MLKAIIFDFNGVILLDEPYHFQSMSEAMTAFGVRITEQEYYRDYLPLDDLGALQAICCAHSLELTESQRAEILTRKPKIYDGLHPGGRRSFPVGGCIGGDPTGSPWGTACSGTPGLFSNPGHSRRLRHRKAFPGELSFCFG
jgi:hypothetical protein